MKTYEKKITGLDMFYLVKRILRRNMRAYFKYIKRCQKQVNTYTLAFYSVGHEIIDLNYRKADSN